MRQARKSEKARPKDPRSSHELTFGPDYPVGADHTHPALDDSHEFRMPCP